MNIYNYNNILNPIHHVGFNQQDINTHIDEHVHDYIEIVCHIKGSPSIHYIDGAKVELKQGQYTIIALNQVHKNIATYSTILNLVIPVSFLDVLLFESSYDAGIVAFKFNLLNNFYNQAYSMSESLYNLIGKIYSNQQQQEQVHMYSYRQKLLITEFLLNITILFDRSDYIESDLDLIRYIRENLKTASLNEYSKLCNYSASRVSQKIQKSYNMTFGQILQNARLQKASTLLLDSKISITNIVEEIGYTNKTHFYKLFNQKYGITPKQYRDLYNSTKKDLS